MGMSINWAELLLLVLVGWTLLGFLGVNLSHRRGERSQGRRNLAWIAGIWLLYFAILVATSLVAKPRSVSLGQQQCFDSLCFTTTGADIIPGYLARNGEKVVRVSVRIANHSSKRNPGDKHLTAYLLDSRNRRWDEVPGLEGVRLSTPVAAGDSVISTPVFKIASDAEHLRLVFTRGKRLPNLLLLGDRDSLLHPLISVALPR
jgi:hypothetical protein